MQALRIAPPRKFTGEPFSRLLGYVIPKQQAVTVEAQVEAEFKHLQKLLADAPDDAAVLIAEKILQLQERNEK